MPTLQGSKPASPLDRDTGVYGLAALQTTEEGASPWKQREATDPVPVSNKDRVYTADQTSFLKTTLPLRHPLPRRSG